MLRCLSAILTSAIVVLATFTFARAQCVEDPREVRLGKDAENRNFGLRLRSYLCRAGEGQNDAWIKVEFHRLSSAAAAMVVGKTLPSKYLKATIGSPSVVENDVFKAYVDLLKQFGETVEVGQGIKMMWGEGNDDKFPAKKLRLLFNNWNRNFFEIANPDDITPLQNKTIPAGMNFYYVISCKDADQYEPGVHKTCQDYDPKEFTTVFWRPARHSDLNNFRKNLDAYNRILKSASKHDGNGAGLSWPE
jgi:hypothetical protein